ncbi:MAG: glycoside hydrolase family 1 protein [Candidatus Omnitrophica bacterium]|nr:glycoside hydrolase family 1 protein [Candidatus Omnitrophota bacterium]
MYEFPSDFLFGAATSAYQVEGSNSLSDWWEYELAGKLKYHSGPACKHYELYEQDFNLAKELNHNCHRLSIEWSRIEPEEGKFSSQELNHYKKVISALRSRKLEPIVTLHHFTNPIWFSKLGGWSSKKASDYFLRYVSKAVDALSGEVQFWVTINEPMVYLYHSYLLGIWPPNERSLIKTHKAKNNLLCAHINTYRLINSIYKNNNLNKPLISIAQNMQAFVPCIPTLRNKLASYLRAKSFNLEFIERSRQARALDFIGVNYYSRSLVELRGWGLKNFAMDVCEGKHSTLKKNSLGWDIYPEGLYDVLISLKKYKLPVFILENGICTEDDSLRWSFIREHLDKLTEAIKSGIKVLGYIYWSLIDNYEWDKGFAPRFGLIEVDYNTYARTIRESARKLAKVCLERKL